MTRRFRQQFGVLDDLDVEVVGTDPQGSRSGVALHQEDGSWSVTLAGAFGERPPSELTELQAFARGLATPGIAEVAAACEPVGDPLTYHYPDSRWLHWEKLADQPERFLAIGDAVCSFTPVYGQGMSSGRTDAGPLPGPAADRGIARPRRDARLQPRAQHACRPAQSAGAQGHDPGAPAGPPAAAHLDGGHDRKIRSAGAWSFGWEAGTGASLENLLRMARAFGLLDSITGSLDPYATDVGRLRADEVLPERVRRPKTS